MATVKSVLGDIQGGLGNIRASKWKNKNVLAQKPTSYNDANTQVQQANRSKFKTVGQFGRGLLPVAKVGFNKVAVSNTEWNQFMSRNMPVLSVSDGEIDGGLADVTISSGSLPQVSNLAADATGGGNLVTLTWNSNSGAAGASATDILYFGYAIAGSNVSGIATSSETRDSELADLEITDGVVGDIVHIYMFLVNPATKEISDTQTVAYTRLT